MSARALAMEELENVNGGIIQKFIGGGVKIGSKCELEVRV